MSKKKKINKDPNKMVKSINNNVRSSVRKLNPILRGIVGKKVDIAIRDLEFSENCKSLIAISTFFPTIPFKIGFNFLTLDLILLFTDLTVLSLFLSIIFFLLINYFFSSASAGFAFLSAGV